MSLRGLSRIMVTAMIALFVVIPSSAYPAAATPPSSGGQTIAAISGEHSQELATLIAKHINSEDVGGFDMAYDVVVFSGVNSGCQPQIISAVKRGAITVIAGVPDEFDSEFLPVPTITVATETTRLEMDTRTGELVSSEVIDPTKEEAVVPEYLVYVLFGGGGDPRSFCFAALTNSPKQHQYVSERAAQEVASILLEPASLPLGLSDWTAKRDPDHPPAYCLITLNDGLDQLIARHEVYQLKYYDEQYQKDYWLVVSYTDHYLPSYHKNLFECGPYVNEREMSVDCSSGASIVDYGPNTTPGDHVASVSIGFSITTSGAGLNVGYSDSWSNPGVTYLASHDDVNRRVGWVEQFGGADWSWYPTYEGPTPAAYNSYQAKPAVVLRTQKGSSFFIDHWTTSWRIYRDQLVTFIPPFIIVINHNAQTYTFSENWLSFSSMFGGGGGGGGCPFLQVWDGSDYVDEGLLDIHNAEGTDVIYEHTLAAVPEPAHGRYAFRLTEHPMTISDIDQVQLRAILEDGTMQELPLKKAWHSEDGNVRNLLLYSDDLRAEEKGADHNGGISQGIDLEFAALGPQAEAVGFIFTIEGYNPFYKT
jgi:hypothetical protein